MSGSDARNLLRRARSATLATNLSDDASGGAPDTGWPYASLVTIACDTDASPILLLSGLSDHTRNLARDNRASLLIEAASGRANPQTGPRVSLLGRVVCSQDERHRRRFLARHPSAKLYANFADFNVYRMVVERAHFVGGFGRAMWLDAGDILFEPAAAAAIAAAEPAIIARLQGDQAEAVAQAAQRLLARPGGGWRLIAVDPEGCDLRRRGAVARLDFPSPVRSDRELALILDHMVNRSDERNGP